MLQPNSIVRMALKVEQALEKSISDPANALHAKIREILVVSRLLRKQNQTFTIARQHCWLRTLARLEESLLGRVRKIHESASEILSQSRSLTRPVQPTLRDLFFEIRQLEEEFSAVRLDLKAGIIAVDTDCIELEGMYLGAFRINLTIANLARWTDARAFEVEALDPQPAASNSDMVHPHVQDGKVCAGDGSIPIAAALREGRLADAFLAINSVLNTYNPASPYISLDDWEGIRCSDCESLVDDDHRYTCESCGSSVCDDCSACCDQCQNIFCRSCLETIEEPESKYLCRHCRAKCVECDQFAATEDIEDGLCLQCFKQHQQEQENNHEHSIPSTAPADPGAATLCAATNETPVPAPA